MFLPLRLQNTRCLNFKKRSHLQPLAATRVAASGRKWPQGGGCGCVSKWPQVAASGRKWPQVAASGRKWPQVAASGGKRRSKWQQVAASSCWPQGVPTPSAWQPLAATRVAASGRRGLLEQVAATQAMRLGRKWRPEVAASGRKWRQPSKQVAASGRK